MPATRQPGSRRATRPPTRSAPVAARSSASRSMTRQAAQLERETRMTDLLARYGCLWEEHSHYIRLKEKTKEGMSSTYDRALDRWLNSPEFSRWRNIANYAAEKDGFLDWIDGLIRSRSGPYTEVSTEEHWIVTFAAFGVSDLLRCNDPCMRNMGSLGRIESALCPKLVECARRYQDSEPDFLNHPACPTTRDASPQHMLLPNIGDTARLGVIFDYKTPTMRRARTCIVVKVSVALDGSEYTIKHLTATDPDGERTQSVLLTEDEFQEIWDARVQE